MAIFDFPASPTLNQTYTFGNKTWMWNGVGWTLSNNTGFASLLINNSGSGVASGTYYNGTTATTISFNSVGAPSTTGTNASGTWSISITGNAATVTNGVYTNATQTITGATTFSGVKTTFTGIAGNMAASDLTGTIQVENNGGTGDTNMAMIVFNATSNYNTKLGLRADGYVGIGGGSSATWRWYSAANGDMVASGNVTAYSDPRLKENFQIIQSPLSILKQLDGGSFNWKSGIAHILGKAGKRDYGVLANQVEKVMPEIVSNSVDIDGESYKTVAYEKLIPVLIEAIKELEQRIAVLEIK